MKVVCLGLNVGYDDLPAGSYPEYAFIGRSNVGKSSLLNGLLGQRALVRTSAKPGKTRALSLFLVDETWSLVDMPGYGWARRSKKEREAMRGQIQHYLSRRDNLSCVFLLLDIRRLLGELDTKYMLSIGEAGIPLALVLTKVDKLSRPSGLRQLASLRHQLSEHWAPIPPIFFTSALARTGYGELLAFIQSANKCYASALK